MKALWAEPWPWKVSRSGGLLEAFGRLEGYWVLEALGHHLTTSLGDRTGSMENGLRYRAYCGCYRSRGCAGGMSACAIEVEEA